MIIIIIIINISFTFFSVFVATYSLVPQPVHETTSLWEQHLMPHTPLQKD